MMNFFCTEGDTSICLRDIILKFFFVVDDFDISLYLYDVLGRFAYLLCCREYFLYVNKEDDNIDTNHCKLWQPD